MICENPITLTSAQNKASIRVNLVIGSDACCNSRIMPYSELYRQRTGVIETPIEHLQKAADDEKRRKS
jgi:hypothetical protein